MYFELIFEGNNCELAYLGILEEYIGGQEVQVAVLNGKALGLAFTKDELKNLVAFYKSPLGQKSLQVLPEMTNAGGNLGKKYAEKYSENFKENLTRIMKKYPRE